MRSFYNSLLVFMMMFVTYLNAYPDRIPVDEHPEICESMDPTGHNTTARTDESPYKIIYNTEGCYSNRKIHVTIYHEMEGGFFEGVFLQARAVSGSKQSVGTFENNGDNMFRPYSCGDAVNNTFGHKGHDHFYRTVLTWTPPEGLTSDIEFVATMVRSTYRYWLNVKSSTLRHSATCNEFTPTDPALLPTTKATTSVAPSMHSNVFSSLTLVVYLVSSMLVLLR